MVQLSKHVLSVSVWSQVWGKLLDFVYLSPSREATDLILKNLLTPTEQQVIAKRLLASVLLLSQWNPYEIARLIHLSTASVYKLKNQLDTNPIYQKQITQAFPEPIPYSKDYLQKNLEDILSKVFSKNHTASRVLFSQH